LTAAGLDQILDSVRSIAAAAAVYRPIGGDGFAFSTALRASGLGTPGTDRSRPLAAR
jgi:hypothetical protein